MRAVRSILILAALLCGSAGFAFAALGAPQVVVVPIDGTVDDGMAHIVSRAIDDAQNSGAQAVVLDINSGGGLVPAAFEIRDAILASKVPVYAFVDGRAYSAAALIALSASRIAIAPGSSIGAAEPLLGSDVPSLRGQFESTALRNHRDVTLAGAMVDKQIDAPLYKPTGSVLTLNTDDAVRAHVADTVAPALPAALAAFNLSGAQVVDERYSWGEQLARFATNPWVSSMLLTVGLLGLLIEMQTLHGIAGTIGVLALALFFGTHVYAGFSNGLVIALAVLGLLGILWELHVVPGHGIPGVLGALLLAAAVVMAFGIPFIFVALEVIATAVVLAVILFSLATRAFPRNAWTHRLALTASQGSEYVTSSDFRDLHGRIGTATSFLRPAGIATIDGRRVDVLTEGEFIAQGTPVRVNRVEGARVFVESVDLPSYQ
jgi:membrane-bound serine protease (ClpP class)